MTTPTPTSSGETGPSLTDRTPVQRVWDELARLGWCTRYSRRRFVFADHPERGRRRVLVADWRESVERFGPDSGPARGALLDMVRLAWGSDDIWARHLGRQGLQKWEVCMGASGLALGITELLSLVAALATVPGGGS